VSRSFPQLGNQDRPASTGQASAGALLPYAAWTRPSDLAVSGAIAARSVREKGQ